MLAARGLLDSKVLEQLDQGVGFLQVANDLHLLAKVLRTAWPQIHHKCAMPPRDLDNAEKLALRLLRELDRRDEAAAEVARAAEMRQRAFTLAFRTYDRICAAVTYLRYDYRGANEFVPSVFPKHGRRKAEEKSAAAE